VHFLFLNIFADSRCLLAYVRPGPSKEDAHFGSARSPLDLADLADPANRLEGDFQANKRKLLMSFQEQH